MFEDNSALWDLLTKSALILDGVDDPVAFMEYRHRPGAPEVSAKDRNRIEIGQHALDCHGISSILPYCLCPFPRIEQTNIYI